MREHARADGLVEMRLQRVTVAQRQMSFVEHDGMRTDGLGKDIHIRRYPCRPRSRIIEDDDGARAIKRPRRLFDGTEIVEVIAIQAGDPSLENPLFPDARSIAETAWHAFIDNTELRHRMQDMLAVIPPKTDPPYRRVGFHEAPEDIAREEDTAVSVAENSTVSPLPVFRSARGIRIRDCGRQMDCEPINDRITDNQDAVANRYCLITHRVAPQHYPILAK